MARKITEKEKKFCQHVARGMTLTDSAEAAGYKAKNRNTLKKIASDVRGKAHIEEYIASLTSDEIVTTTEILVGIAEIARNTEEKAGDRLRAFELLGKNKKLFTDKVETEHSGGMTIEVAYVDGDD